MLSACTNASTSEVEKMVSTVWAWVSVFKPSCTNNDLHLGMTVSEVRDETPLSSKRLRTKNLAWHVRVSVETIYQADASYRGTPDCENGVGSLRGAKAQA